MHTLTVKANAKINLALNVKYRREDGYHEIETVLQEISFFDLLSLRQSDRISFTCDDPKLAEEQDNLCVKAAELAQRKFGISGLDIHLQKRIPIGAGLGGGSSDAAAVLKGALAIHNIQTSQEQLLKLSEQLGSDVPFFVIGRSAYAVGRGDRLLPVSLPCQYQVLLVLPDIHISTAWAYKNLKMGLTQHLPDDKFKSSELQSLNATNFRSVFFNSFEKTIFRVYPNLAEIKRSLYESNAIYAAMSGSGSSIFGLFNPEIDLKPVMDKFSEQFICQIVKPVC
jgi:4-diphosphocytidyl-2-C-methyl-D-erythritol kinase